MNTERVDLRQFQGQTDTKLDEIARRREYLISLGFGQEWLEKVSLSRPALLDPEVIKNRLRYLLEYGFRDPIKMAESFSSILSYTSENIDSKIAGHGVYMKIRS